ncbi:MAG TPA: FKBP-type peptidyl-prolyl cis-trans isomerase [Kofleriaceae bacterium]|nr:FKBP-type peptidyl-prolyl cis-trans isomerase [Kofleriaceae bacterium]
MRGVVIALVLLAQLQAARADEGVDVPGLDAPDLRGDALVWEDATFYLEPWEGGAHVRFQTLSRGRRDDVGRTIPVQIVSSTRTFVEVEPSATLGCASRRVEVDPRVEALRLFVKRDDLAPVLTKPYSVTYPDGTGVRLAAGVPVWPTPSGLYMVSARGDKLRLPIPHAAVGYLFASARVPEPERLTGPLVQVDRMTSVRLGGDPLEVRARWLAPKPAKQAETQLLRWSARCIDLTVAVPRAALRPGSSMTPYRSHDPGTPMPKHPQHLLRGTPLATPSGREVAVAADAIDVELPEGAASACFDARLTAARTDDPPQSPVHRMTKLCASAAHVIGAARPAARPVPRKTTGAPEDVAAPPPGARRTAKGVWYRVLAPGKGARTPTATERVKVHYTGWTTDGKEIDSSVARGVPAVFPLAGVIPGWTDGLQVMTVGMKARFWIPEELAYKGLPGRPAGMLVFDVELLEIL